MFPPSGTTLPHTGTKVCGGTFSATGMIVDIQWNVYWISSYHPRWIIHERNFSLHIIRSRHDILQKDQKSMQMHNC